MKVYSNIDMSYTGQMDGKFKGQGYLKPAFSVSNSERFQENHDNFTKYCVEILPLIFQ